MKVTIEFGDEIEQVVQEHLSTGLSVQKYVKTAVAYFNTMLTIERLGGNLCGYGDKSRFKSYNTVLNPIGISS